MSKKLKIINSIANIFCLNYLAKYFFRKRLYVIGYHSINNIDNRDQLLTKLYPDISTDFNLFEQQIQYLVKNKHTFIQFKDLNNISKKINKPTIIYFDDGFKDNLLNARPILSKYNIKPTIFVTTDLLSKKDMLWTMKLRNHLYNLNKDISSSKVESEIIKLKKMDDFKIKENLESILKEDFFNYDNFNIFLTWEELKILLDDGWEIGSHGVSHHKLTLCDNEELIYELSESMNEIKKHLGINIEIFSYPHGRFNNNVLDNLKTIGYKYAISTHEGLNSIKTISKNKYILKKISPKNNEDINYFRTRLYAKNLLDY